TGFIVSTNVATSRATVEINVDLSSVTTVTATVPSITVTTLVAVKPPSTVFTVIVALPAATGVTTPFTTVATAASEVDHVTDLFISVARRVVTATVPTCSPKVYFK